MLGFIEVYCGGAGWDRKQPVCDIVSLIVQPCTGQTYLQA